MAPLLLHAQALGLSRTPSTRTTFLENAKPLRPSKSGQSSSNSAAPNACGPRASERMGDLRSSCYRGSTLSQNMPCKASCLTGWPEGTTYRTCYIATIRRLTVRSSGLAWGAKGDPSPRRMHYNKGLSSLWQTSQWLRVFLRICRLLNAIEAV